MGKALFVCYGGGHAGALIPVMKYLISKTNIQVEAIGINLAADLLRKQGIPCKTLSDYLDVRSVEIGFPLAKDRHNFSSAVSFADSIAYYGYTMSDLIDEVGEEAAYQILNIFDRRTMFPARTMMRILQKETPDVVITTTMNRFEAAALYAAGQLGIASLKVEDLIGRINKTFPDKIQVDTEAEREKLLANGILRQNIILKSELKNPLVMGYYEEIYQRQLETRPTAFAVLCDYAKNEIVRRGIDPASIHVTGQPAFDKHPWYLKNTDKQAVCDKIGVDYQKKVVAFMSQPTREREDVFRILMESAKSIDLHKIQFVVKLHPNEDGKIQELIMEEFGINSVKLIKNMDARELIAVSDLIITVSSTTGLEAAVMGKPLLYINTTDFNEDIPFDNMGIGIRCSTADELADQIGKIFNGEGDDKIFQNKKYATDGKAAERVGEMARKLAKKEYMPTKKVVTIIQARMGSTRLPGKVMKDICGKPQIQHVIDNVSKSKFVSQTVVATSNDGNNEPLKNYLSENGIEWFAGDETDVLSRFVLAGKAFDADIIVRVTADNPLCNAECIDRMIESHIQTNSDYTCMTGLPIGITGEIVGFGVLENIYYSEDIDERDREHVTIYVYEHPEKYKINNVPAPMKYNFPQLYLTVDTAADFERMTDIFQNCYDNGEISLEDVINYMKRL
ncbi:hypothetical protein D3Z51_06700 [Clostridiaceae bacterium]|nr:hypothetical protein [Clostridiaceae bacterium]RKI17429.1 hypothetical protein D7V81_02765 [bacterium 1XD21-70]